ncbi:MAG: hypothetical protein EA376_03270 [Phycisphaeraceae bacterium]|nr:MAG: hypothetical protein EA376_03270 [Phycisphaeraceae bacterium]
MKNREAYRVVAEIVEGRLGWRRSPPSIALMLALAALCWGLGVPLEWWALLLAPVGILIYWYRHASAYSAARAELTRCGAGIGQIDLAIARHKLQMRRRYDVWSRRHRKPSPPGLTPEQMTRWLASSRIAHARLRAMGLLCVMQPPLVVAMAFMANAPGVIFTTMMIALAILSFLFVWRLTGYLRARAAMLAIRRESASGVMGALSRPIGKRGHREG